jgi:hypothetical protein
MCKKSEESIDHLLHCEIAIELWSLLSICLVLHRFASKGEKAVGELERTFGTSYYFAVWKLAPLCLI